MQGRSQDVLNEQGNGDAVTQEEKLSTHRHYPGDASIINYNHNSPFDHDTKMKQRLDLRASLTTIKCRLHASGLFARRPARKPRLTVQHKDGLAFCQQNLHRDWGR